VEEEEK
jgi:hypothetical protein